MNRIANAVLFGLAWCLIGFSALANTPAALKLEVTLDAGVITVADIWDNAGAKAKMVVGPAPPPGRSIAIETGQLAYIAQLYDVEWRPVSGVERVSIERSGRPLTRDEMTPPLRRALEEAGASSTVTVDIANFDPIQVPRMSFPLLTVEAMSYDPASEQFSANIAASTDGMKTQRIRVTGRVAQLVAAVVATHRLQPGDPIGRDDLKVVQMSERRVVGPVATDIEQVLGLASKRTIMPGQQIVLSDVGPPVLVEKGSTVVLVLDTPGMSLSAQGLALGAGGRGDVIEVMNPHSRAVVAARVVGRGRAVVSPGSSPTVASARSTSLPVEVAN